VGNAYQVKYVPLGIFVDEEGRLVRPVGSVNIEDESFRAELVEWITSGRIPKAWIDADAATAATAAGEGLPTAEEQEANARFQLGLTLLEAGKRDEAIAELKRAYKLDRGNWIIRKQLWALENPDAFYRGRVDYAWQKKRIAIEDR
jgi:hypothetical protein